MEKLLTANDTVQYFGGALKALGDGWVEGPLIRFGDVKDTDLEREYFDKTTDYDVDWKAEVKSTVYYDHGQDPTLGQKKLGGGQKAILTMSDSGVWAKAQLDMHDEYEAMIYGLVEQKKLGWSSGTSPHVVEREAVGKSFHIKKWPLGIDATITPTPAEYRNVISTVKSIKHVPLKSLMASEEPIEETILGDDLNSRLTYNAISSICDTFMWYGIWNIIYNDFISAEEKATKLDSGADELAAKIKLYARALIMLDPESLSAEYAAAKSLSFATPEIKRGAKLQEHIKYVLDEVKNLGSRITTINKVSGGLKKGAEFNATNKTALNDLGDKLSTVSSEIVGYSDMLKEMIGTGEQDDSQKSTTLEAMEISILEARMNQLNNERKQCQL